jgi:hypothetical protein
MHTTRGEYTNAYIKWVRDMCVTCLSEDLDVSFPSTKRVVLRTDYSTEGTSINTLNKHKQTIQANRKVSG